MKVNRAELAEVFDISLPTVTAWTGEGMPYLEAGAKGKPWYYDTVACMDWWAENKRRRARPTTGPSNFDGPGDMPETYDEAERRKMVANADKAELELAKAAGRVVEIEDVAASVAEMHVKVRTRLLSIGNKVRVRVSAYFGGDKVAEEAVVGVVEEVVTDAIAEIRNNPFDGDAETGEPDERP